MPTDSPKTLPEDTLLALRAAVAQLGERQVARLLSISANGVRGALTGKTRSAATTAHILRLMPRIRDAARLAGRGTL